MNYQKEMEKIIETLKKEGKVPTLLLHSCCGPCSSSVLEYLSRYFQVTLFFYNPNIFPEEEYSRRIVEQQMLIDKLEVLHPISFCAGTYDNERFEELARGKEEMKEGGERCFACYELRLREAVDMARKGGFDFVTTTLTVSPMKSAEKLNAIGKKLAEEYGVQYLPSDFKKKNGYKRSIELSKQYHLYRQDYCGCRFSVRTKSANSEKEKR
ncbi:epoxyqueuosine reductase QueH [Suipraeoptans intestinalis]|uniref:epoxyqueuosine reductase QueH n=1 Tax=Suipraeoptans intestinalis TaxID=2606628 RepID=UPI0023F145C5|nr:epoxyqueuosine reductase QueH [Suipraeoptans intestinalis]MDD7770137.1 epoxyqueuosine reductase QueH [Suipraeoptans intestinalis]MDY3122288.1 epoxyqueuosine reductase QueH [Suipraeoptans intestinalis]